MALLGLALVLAIQSRANAELRDSNLREQARFDLAMEAIRTVNPQAKLVQTEDYGRVFSTPELRYQADFENARRLLGLDLLCGSFDPDAFAWIGSSGYAVAPEALARLMGRRRRQMRRYAQRRLRSRDGGVEHAQQQLARGLPADNADTRPQV